MSAAFHCDGLCVRLRPRRAVLLWALALAGCLAASAHPSTAGAALSVPHTSELRGIACPTAKLCDAVGINQAGTKAVVVPIHVRTGDTNTQVDRATPIPDLQLAMAVACPTAKTCEVVGQTDTGEVDVVPVTSHDPDPGTAVPLSSLGVGAAIACPQRDLCDIAGWTNAPQGAVVPFDVPSATAGTAKLTPQAAELAGIACPNTTTCIASGTTALFGGGTGEVVGVDAATAASQGATGEPDTVSLGPTACPAADRCFALGDDGSDPVVVDVSSYTTPGDVQTPPHSQGVFYYGLACPRGFVCEGVGTDSSVKGATTPIVRGIAARTTEIRAASFLQAIACPTAAECLRVGSRPDGGLVLPQRAADPSPNRPDGATCQGQRRNGGDQDFVTASDSLPREPDTNLDAIYTTITSAPACRDPESGAPTSSWDMLQVPVNDPIFTSGDKLAFVQGGIFYACEKEPQANRCKDTPDHPFVELAYPPLRTPTQEWHDDTISIHEGPPAHVDVTFTSTPAPNPRASSGRFGIQVGNLTTAPSTCDWVPAAKRDQYEKYEGNMPSPSSPKVEITLTINGKCLWKYYMPAAFANDLWWGQLAVELHTAAARSPGTFSDPIAFTDSIVTYGGSSTYFVPQLSADDPVPGGSPFLKVPGTCQADSPLNGPSWAFYVWSENDYNECNPWTDLGPPAALGRR